MSTIEMHVDEVIISHTNENEFNAFVSNKKNEALKDRMILVKVPYNLRLDEEIHIYEKLLGDSGMKGVHIAPHTLRIASLFAILTRLEPSKKAGLSPMKKLKLYNGENVDGYTSKDLKELQDEAQREGMMGISPVCIPD
jgi:serine protein kinase